MKIYDIPQAGKRGLNVSQGGRYGQISRAMTFPAQPRTAAQMSVRFTMATVTSSWRTLTEDQRTAWTNAAKSVNSVRRVGTNGPLTGAQLFTKINCTLGLLGAAPVTDPPVKPAMEASPVGALVITNVAGVVALKVGCANAPGVGTIVRASRPVSAGRSVYNDFRVIGVLPAPAQGSSDITALYVAKFGAPPAGTKVFVSIAQTQNGWEDLPVNSVAVVPAAA